jgi:hypothetical protein
MNRRPRIPISEPVKQTLADIAGEPLAGSGFEDEMPDSDLTERGQLFPGAPMAGSRGAPGTVTVLSVPST